MKIVLFEAGPLSAGRDAGTQADLDFIDGVRALGHWILVLTEAEFRITDVIATVRPDVLVISRPGLFARLFAQVRHFAGPIVYLAHDVHHERLRLQSEVGAADETAWRVMQMVERFCFESATLSLLPTDEDTSLVRERFPKSRVVAIPYFNMQRELDSAGNLPRITTPSGCNLVFIGGSSHHPNLDGMEWFTKTIIPQVAKTVEAFRVQLIGHWDPRATSRVAHQKISLLGVLDSQGVTSILSSSDIGIAPLRFGSGMKRKVLHYMAHGIPVLSTSYGVQGLLNLDCEHSPNEVEGEVIPGVMLCNSADEWISCCSLMSSTPSLRKEMGQRGRAFISSHFSAESYLGALRQMLSMVS